MARAIVVYGMAGFGVAEGIHPSPSLVVVKRNSFGRKARGFAFRPEVVSHVPNSLEGMPCILLKAEPEFGSLPRGARFSEPPLLLATFRFACAPPRSFRDSHIRALRDVRRLENGALAYP